MKGLLIRGVNNKKELEMIYLDNKGDISQRRIKILSVYEDYFRAYCFTKRQQRTFKVSNILSIGPVSKVKRGA
ncbi:hypothetical protein MHI57_16190 [Cytobacillus sp. FSL K6-0129]|uniref:hypothetical protein n=1 Tax=Cytobacillus sp. FSL K6-0129 TaxID=2921421 RepID=UPI0030FA5DFC